MKKRRGDAPGRCDRMQSRSLASSRVALVAAFAGVAAIVHTAPLHAEIRAFSGRVHAIARGLADAPEDSFTRDDDAYARTVEPPIIDATALLQTTDIAGNPLAAGRSIVILGDPRSSTGQNPGEFALECGAFSNDARIAYQIEAFAGENRDLRFTLADVLGSAAGSPRQVVSQVFLSGALVFWVTTGQGGLTGAAAEFTGEVHDARLPDAPVLRVHRRFEGDASGAVFEAASESAGVRGDDLPTTILDLEALRGSDAPEAATLVEQADRLGIDTFVVVLIGPQPVEYAYSLMPGETFGLEAQFTLVVESAPAGTGVAGVMGRPFAGLADLFEQSRTDADGKILERSLNKLMETHAPAGGKPDAPVLNETEVGGGNPLAGWPTGLCGAFGAEALLALSLGCICLRSAARPMRRLPPTHPRAGNCARCTGV
ncbi:MAG: hypothetical protein IT449_02990 [Phycisphaerales bacterium]|nr:hypothetical protein [Phycisphaerales bacterium]